MKFRSTRNKAEELNFSKACLQGLASDGGLYVPTHWPVMDHKNFDLSSLANFAAQFFQPFLKDDPLQNHISSICHKAFDFAIPINKHSNSLQVLELFHGPTAAFKDVGARFLAQCFEQLGESRKILVATSGDTGGAVAAAFYQKQNLSVTVLFPEQGVSTFQKHQLCCWGHNIQSLAVKGSFDDCQRLVKEAFADSKLCAQYHLSSANSINIGRLLPQAIYYAYHSSKYFHDSNQKMNFIIPSGNAGNAVAAIWARHLGFPIDKIIMASNQNQAIVDFVKSGKINPRPSVQTLANAMDVGHPSNLERILDLYPNQNLWNSFLSAHSVGDQQIRQTLTETYAKTGWVACPHTACGIYVSSLLNLNHTVVVATAHAAKFKDVIEPVIGQSVPYPKSLSDLLNRQTQFEAIEPKLSQLVQKLGVAKSH